MLQETSEKLQNVEKDLQNSQQQLITKDEQVTKLKEQLEATVQKLNESREVLKTNENVISWLNKQLNEKQLSRKPQSAEPSDHPSVLSTTTGLRAQFYPVSGRPAVSPSAAADSPPAEQRAAQYTHRHSLGDAAGLDSKYFERRDDSIPLYGLSSNLLQREVQQRTKHPVASAYFSA